MITHHHRSGRPSRENATRCQCPPRDRHRIRGIPNDFPSCLVQPQRPMTDAEWTRPTRPHVQTRTRDEPRCVQRIFSVGASCDPGPRSGAVLLATLLAEVEVPWPRTEETWCYCDLKHAAHVTQQNVAQHTAVWSQFKCNATEILWYEMDEFVSGRNKK